NVDLKKEMSAHHISVRIGVLENDTQDEEKMIYFVWETDVFGSGIKEIVAPLAQFDCISSRTNLWSFVRSIEINEEVSDLEFIKAENIYATAKVLSKSAKSDEMISYDFTVLNCKNSPVAVSILTEKSGYEVLSCEVEPKSFL
ncbi:MAG: hypothetical protein RSA27_03810, partial [Oscillospiraceae bacterium]